MFVLVAPVYVIFSFFAISQLRKHGIVPYFTAYSLVIGSGFLGIVGLSDTVDALSEGVVGTGILTLVMTVGCFAAMAWGLRTLLKIQEETSHIQR